MKTGKEYPATHSMATSWYCVDEDGNVGIFDIDDNGPVPVDGYRQNCVEEVFWEDFSSDGKQFRKLNLRPEQITQLLEPMDIEDIWESSYDGKKMINVSWMDVILQIDMDKFDIFKKALLMDPQPFHPLVCISEEMGLFYTDLYYNKLGVELLEQNDVVKARYKAPTFDYIDEDDVEEQKRIQKENQKLSLYIYKQNYCVFRDPAIRVVNPASPIKIEQLPEDIRKTIRKLPVKFKEKERIQLAELIPVYGIWSIRYVYDNKIWWELASSDKDTIYYNESSNSIIPKSDMVKYIQDGLAEEYDYNNDRHYQLQRGEE